MYGDLKQNDSALIYLSKALIKFQQLKNSHGELTTLLNLGSTYLDVGNLSKAEEYLEKSEVMANSQSDVIVKARVLGKLSELYKKQGKYTKAYQYLKEFNVLQDSLISAETNERINELEIQYETAKKEQSILELKQENDKRELLLAKEKLSVVQRNRLIGLLTFGTIITILFALYFMQRNKRKAQAEKDAALIEEKDKGARAIFQAQEEERKRISKDLHDGVGQQLSGLKMAFQQLGKYIGENSSERTKEVEILTKIVSDSADEVRAISHQMMPKALTELGLIEALSDMLENSLGLLKINYEFEHFGINERLQEEMEISLYRITQELVNNIIKHAEASLVNVQLFKNQENLILIVEDNGRGIEQKDNQGHGLLNMKSRVNTLKGEINIEPSPSSGIIATIRIPIT